MEDRQMMVTVLSVADALAAFVGTHEVPLQQVTTLLHVAYRGEASMQDLEKLTACSQSAVSRNVARLGPGPTPKDPGYKLLEAFEDPWYRKRKLVRLTERGKECIAALTKAANRFAKGNR